MTDVQLKTMSKTCFFFNLCGKVKKKKRIKYKWLQGAKERGRPELPNLKLYFAACCLVWVKD